MADISRLPGPNADIWDWQLIGLCRGEDPNVFFTLKASVAQPASIGTQPQKPSAGPVR